MGRPPPHFSTGVHTEAAKCFARRFSEGLRGRKKPFIPTSIGLAKPSEVALPPVVDREGFWQGHFAEALRADEEGARTFLAPEHDGRKTREFLALAGVTALANDRIIDLIEAAADGTHGADWWYDCFSHMSQDEKLQSRDHAYFEGRRLLSLESGETIRVPERNASIVCLPPEDDRADIHVPQCFQEVFVFLEPGVASRLRTGDERVRAWVESRLHVVSFEASSLVPRAVRSVAPKLFGARGSSDISHLQAAWGFLKSITAGGRAILAEGYWRDLGRFPVPVSQSGDSAPQLFPAFLTFLPDNCIDESSCLFGVPGLPRLASGFVAGLCEQSGDPLDDWLAFLAHAGVSRGPKLLSFSRVVAGGADVPLAGSALKSDKRAFCGERQLDENEAVMRVFKRHPHLWTSMVSADASCGHDSVLLLRACRVTEAFAECVAKASAEHEAGDDNWRARLEALVRELPAAMPDVTADDEAWCPAGGAHEVAVGSCVERQLDSFAWLPSSRGPGTRSQCFARLPEGRFVSSGASDWEIGDALLPYVVAENIQQLAKLERLGVERLEDASSASPAALVRALVMLGKVLSSDWGHKQIVAVRSRWRLVRGAIQEAYRCLNRATEEVALPEDLLLATRAEDGIEFSNLPLFYAEPGSALERAFMPVLPLLDADRPHPDLFECLGVTRLRTGHTVSEQVETEGTPVEAGHLRTEIVEQLVPWLLAPILAKSDHPEQAQEVMRRLTERFQVVTTPALHVSFSLTDNPQLRGEAASTAFYLQRELGGAEGAVRRAYCTLFIAGDDRISLSRIDGDALGDCLVSLFMDDAPQDLASLFPRIASRYQHVGGDEERMKEFMHLHLHIQPEVLENARAMVLGEPVMGKAATPPPEAVVIVLPSGARGEETEIDQSSVEDDVADKAKELVGGMLGAGAGGGPGSGGAGGKGGGGDSGRRTSGGGRAGRITPEQERRGRQGEELVRRSLELPDGWSGFRLREDVRQEGCGYDFLCSCEGREVKLEVKAFTENGRVVMSSNELREAATSKEDYYLIGLLDNGRPASEWVIYRANDPIHALLRAGTFQVDAKLQVRAAEIFRTDEA